MHILLIGRSVFQSNAMEEDRIWTVLEQYRTMTLHHSSFQSAICNCKSTVSLTKVRFEAQPRLLTPLAHPPPEASSGSSRSWPPFPEPCWPGAPTGSLGVPVPRWARLPSGASLPPATSPSAAARTRFRSRARSWPRPGGRCRFQVARCLRARVWHAGHVTIVLLCSVVYVLLYSAVYVLLYSVVYVLLYSVSPRSCISRVNKK